MRSALLLIPLLFLPVLAVASGQGPAAPLDDAALLGAGFLDGHPDMKFRQWGMDALQRGDAEAAMDNFRKAARYADKPAQGLLGEMYWYGVKRAADPVMAFAWMDVAAERGYPLMLELRDKYWAALPLEQHDIARAQALRLRDEYGDAAARPRLAAELQRGKRAMTGSRTLTVQQRRHRLHGWRREPNHQSRPPLRSHVLGSRPLSALAGRELDENTSRHRGSRPADPDATSSGNRGQAITQGAGSKPAPCITQYSVRSGAPAGGGVYWYSQVSVRVLPPLRRYRRMSICSLLPSGGTRSNIAR